MKSKKTTIMTTVIAILLILVAVAGSYAYYIVRVDNTNAVSVDVTAKNLGTTFDDGPEINADNILPGSTFIKTFSVENTGTMDVTFDIKLVDVINQLTNKADLTYTLTGPDGAIATDVQYPSADGNIITGRTIVSGATQNFTLTIVYENTSSEQNVDMNKTIAGTVQIDNVVEVTE